MSKHLVTLLLALFTITFISCTKTDLVATGQLENAEGETLYLDHIATREINTLDSIKVDKDGSFTLKTDLKGLGFYRLRLSQNNFIPLLLDSIEQIEVTGNALNLQENYTVSGSAYTEKMTEINQAIRKVSLKVDSLNKLYQQAQMSGQATPDQLNPLKDQIMALIAEQKATGKKFIEENKNSIVALSAIEMLNPDEHLQTYIEVSDALESRYPDSEYVKNFMVRVNDLKRLAIGYPAPQMVMQDLSGNQISLSDFKGKVTLIDFWASWCGPCRMENPNVVKVYNKYKDKGFEIFGVSLDKSKDAWAEAVVKDGLVWKHGSELGFWNSTFCKSYNLQSIPMTYLLDQEGKIIAKGLRGATLEQKLEEIFNS